MKRFLPILIFALALSFLGGCSGNSNEVEKPENLIEREEMTQLLKQIQLVEAKYQRRLFTPKSEIKEKALEQYAHLLASEKVTLEQFKSSFMYYKQQPELLAEMFNQVIEELSKEQAEQQKILKREVEEAKSTTPLPDSAAVSEK